MFGGCQAPALTQALRRLCPNSIQSKGYFKCAYVNKLEKIHTCWGERWIRAEAKLLSSEFMMSDYVLDCTEYSSMHLYSEKYCEKQNENVKSMNQLSDTQ